jgi:hypothetical protein
LAAIAGGPKNRLRQISQRPSQPIIFALDLQLSLFLFINIVERKVQLVSFHQHRGEAEKRHFFFICFQ